MEGSTHHRLLSIGEFAAATQLTPKALRLYDDQGLLRPAITDSSNGYRYYRADQVSDGRLIRSLRDMSLTLVQIDQVLRSDRGHRELLMRTFLREAEQRLARERTAYQTALLTMHSRTAPHSTTIADVTVPAQIVSVWDLISDRRFFNERYRERQAVAIRDLKRGGIDAKEGSWCVLLEPVTDEEARLELRIPIGSSHNQNPNDVVLRHVPARRYASVTTSASSAHDGFTPAIDALFDWFDRNGLHALGQPEVLLHHDDLMSATVRWAISAGGAQNGDLP